MKRAGAVVLTAGLIGLAVFSGRGRGTGGPAAATSPEACLDRMFAAAAAGEAANYLDCFTGDALARLRRTQESRGAAAFVDSLRATAGRLKGYVVEDYGDPPGAEDVAAQRTVERIYPEHNELETYSFRREAGAWRVAGIRPAGNRQPQVAYGTPVFQLPRETEGSAEPGLESVEEAGQ